LKTTLDQIASSKSFPLISSRHKRDPLARMGVLHPIIHWKAN
jgi:hypothetical protein